MLQAGFFKLFCNKKSRQNIQLIPVIARFIIVKGYLFVAILNPGLPAICHQKVARPKAMSKGY